MASTGTSAPPSESESTVAVVTRSAPPSPTKRVRMPATVAETITAGKSLRGQKSHLPKSKAKAPPKPAFPRGLVATDRDVKMSRRATIRQAQCLRKHNIVLSDRMDELSKPTRRQLIGLWRNYADVLSPEQINNLQNLLDAADPFKPDQAYEYFMNLRKQKKRAHDKETGGKEKKKELSALCGDRRFAWVRSATVAFARGIQHRLGRPGSFELEGGMLRLSDIVLAEICSYSKMKPPSRRSRHPKAKFMCEMADKIAVWIDEILAESDERLLMMDFDEDDEEVEAAMTRPKVDTGSSTDSPSPDISKRGSKTNDVKGAKDAKGVSEVKPAADLKQAEEAKPSTTPTATASATPAVSSTPAVSATPASTVASESAAGTPGSATPGATTPK